MNTALAAAVISAILPTLAVLVGILINRSDATRLSGEIAAVRSDLNATRSQLHDDIVMLLNIGREQDARIVRLESRS